MDGNFSNRNVVADWPGATHDSRILQNSGVYRDFEDGNRGLSEVITLDDRQFRQRQERHWCTCKIRPTVA